MSKFWTGAAALLVVGAAVTAFSLMGQNDQINFKDLETECRYDRVSPQTHVDLDDDNSLMLQGHFPEDDSDASADYSYRQNDERIVLNIKTQQTSDLPQNIGFVNDCWASIVYDAETRPLDSGLYNLQVRHNGDTSHESVIKVPE